MAVSTFVAPSLCLVIAGLVLTLDHSETAFSRVVGRITAAVSRSYRGLLAHALRAPLVVLAIAAVLSGASVAL